MRSAPSKTHTRYNCLLFSSNVHHMPLFVFLCIKSSDPPTKHGIHVTLPDLGHTLMLVSRSHGPRFEKRGIKEDARDLIFRQFDEFDLKIQSSKSFLKLLKKNITKIFFNCLILFQFLWTNLVQTR